MRIAYADADHESNTEEPHQWQRIVEKKIIQLYFRASSSREVPLTSGSSLREETPLLLEKGFNFLVSAISDRVDHL